MSEVREVSEYHDAHPTPRAVTYVCEECREPWPSLAAANECAILDAAEARAARRSRGNDGR